MPFLFRKFPNLQISGILCPNSPGSEPIFSVSHPAECRAHCASHIPFGFDSLEVGHCRFSSTQGVVYHATNILAW
jgi:hypothetical protein